MNDLQATVLIVEDESELRKVIQETNEDAGFRTLGAKDGLEALDLLKTNAVDVVVSDLRMPKLGGIELLRAMREANYLQPFIVLTGHGGKLERTQALRFGAYDFLEKPIDLARLVEVVAGAVQIQKAATGHF